MFGWGRVAPLAGAFLPTARHIRMTPTCHHVFTHVMAHPFPPFSRPNRPLVSAGIGFLAIVLEASTGSALAQATAADPTLKAVTIQERGAAPSAGVVGLGDAPLARTPVSAAVIDAAQIEASGAKRLADLIRFDASVSDAYNAGGYWDYLTVRGFVLDNKYNFRREGLPINAETSIGLENKSRVEILKGTSGIQAGTSAPGGLVNYVVKRPTDDDLRSVRAEVDQRGGVLGAVDLGGRFGTDRVFGYRLNVGAERIRSYADGNDGNRELAALALDWRTAPGTLLSAEVEYSRRSQASITGLSLLGNTLPAPNPRLNTNTQPWVQPTLLEGLTGTVKFEQALNADWHWSVQAGTQRLKSDDRTAFPFGCTASNGTYYADRFCPNGDYDLYDYRSDDERRTTDALQLQLNGKLRTGAIAHEVGVGLLRSRTRDRFQDQAYNYVGTGNLATLPTFAPDPTLTGQNTNRDETSTELSAFDRIAWSSRFSTWLGLRHTQLDRDSVRTDGSRPTAYSRGLTTPWLAASYALTDAQMLYASWGQGAESQVVPNKSAQYSNAGEALPLVKSTQREIGLKGASAALGWQVAYFQIDRPMTNLDACNRLGITPCQGAYDGSAKHRGLEASAQYSRGAWRANGGLTLLHARRGGSIAEPANNGQKPTNVPDWTLRAQAAYRFASLPGLEAEAGLSHEGRRNVTPDGAIVLPSWTRLDAALRYGTRMNGVKTTWTLAVDNLADRRFFRESPYQFGHVYLFPAAPRTVRVALQADL